MPRKSRQTSSQGRPNPIDDQFTSKSQKIETPKNLAHVLDRKIKSRRKIGWDRRMRIREEIDHTRDTPWDYKRNALFAEMRKRAVDLRLESLTTECSLEERAARIRETNIEFENSLKKSNLQKGKRGETLENNKNTPLAGNETELLSEDQKNEIKRLWEEELKRWKEELKLEDPAHQDLTKSSARRQLTWST